jgi:hypothetical protein
MLVMCEVTTEWAITIFSIGIIIGFLLGFYISLPKKVSE